MDGGVERRDEEAGERLGGGGEEIVERRSGEVENGSRNNRQPPLFSFRSHHWANFIISDTNSAQWQTKYVQAELPCLGRGPLVLLV